MSDTSNLTASDGRALAVGTLVQWADAGSPPYDEYGIVTYLADGDIGLVFSDGANVDCSSAESPQQLVVLDEASVDAGIVEYLRELAPDYADPDA